jgi:hypothetical protein
MAFTDLELARIKLAVGVFVMSRRPSPEIRDKVDLHYRIERQSVVIFEVRPYWNDPTRILECPIAKTTYVRRSDTWKVFWQRADLKWHGYGPCPEVDELEDFLELVEEDEYGCFWG